MRPHNQTYSAIQRQVTKDGSPVRQAAITKWLCYLCQDVYFCAQNVSMCDMHMPEGPMHTVSRTEDTHHFEKTTTGE